MVLIKHGNWLNDLTKRAVKIPSNRLYSCRKPGVLIGLQHVAVPVGSGSDHQICANSYFKWVKARPRPQT